MTGGVNVRGKAIIDMSSVSGVLTGSAGTDTHAAELTGSASVVDGGLQIFSANGSSDTDVNFPFTNVNSGNDFLSFSVTVPSGTEIMYLWFAFVQGNSNNGNITLEDRTHTTDIENWTLVSGNIDDGNLSTHLTVIENPTVGAATFYIRNTSGLQLTRYMTSIYVKYVSLNDTTSATLTGSAGTDTHAASISGVATGKGIGQGGGRFT